MWQQLSDFIPRLRWLILLLVLAVVFALTRIPATWGAYFITQGNTLGMTGVNGTLWDGRASMTSIEIDNIAYSLGELHWQLEPWSLLSLRPCANVRAALERQLIEGRACASLSGSLKVTDASIDAPADLIQAGIPVPIDGDLVANISILAMKGEQLQELEGNLSWTGARVQAEGNWVSLGNFAAEYSYNGEDAIVAEVFDLDAPMDLDATVTLALAGGVDVQGEVTLEPAFSDRIQAQEWLHLMLESPEPYQYRIDLQY